MNVFVMTLVEKKYFSLLFLHLFFRFTLSINFVLLVIFITLHLQLHFSLDVTSNLEVKSFHDNNKCEKI